MHRICYWRQRDTKLILSTVSSHFQEQKEKRCSDVTPCVAEKKPSHYVDENKLRFSCFLFGMYPLMAQSPKLSYDYKSNLKEIEKAIKLRLCDPDKNPRLKKWVASGVK